MSAVSAECPDPAHSASALVLEASRCAAEGDTQAALAVMAKAAAIEPNSLPLHFATALMAWRSGDFANALNLARACFERQPMNGTIAEVLASLFAQTGDLRESLFHGKLATALQRDKLLQDLVPGDFPAFDKAFLAIQDRPLFARAKFFRASGDIAHALDRASQHVAVAPEDSEARQFYAELLLRFGMAGTAEEMLRSAVRRTSATPALLSLYGRALTEVGDFDDARRWHDKARSAAPGDAVIAGARLADSLWLQDDAKDAAAASASWVDQFAKLGKPAPRRAPREKLVIGYIVSEFFDRGDAAAVAAVARAHDRSAVQVFGYGIGAKTWEENIALGGAFDQWRDISRLDAPTLARTLAGDGLDVVIDVGGFAVPTVLQALARATSILRVAWLQNPVGLAVIYDAVIANDDRGSGARSPHAWPVGLGAYPMVLDGRLDLERTTDQEFRFGADIRFRQLNQETTDLWSALLDAIPRSVLLLRRNDMTSPENIARLIDRFGRGLAGRIDIVDAASPDEFYRHVDLALAPTISSSPRAVAEALCRGVPALALRHDRLGQINADMLEALGLANDLVATSVEDCLAKAKSLVNSTETRSRIGGTIAAAAASARASASNIARAIEQAVRASLTERSA